MNKPYPKGFPHFETEEQLGKLLLEGLQGGMEGAIEVGSPEWDQFLDELKQPQRKAELAS